VLEGGERDLRARKGAQNRRFAKLRMCGCCRAGSQREMSPRKGQVSARMASVMDQATKPSLRVAMFLCCCWPTFLAAWRRSPAPCCVILFIFCSCARVSAPRSSPNGAHTDLVAPTPSPDGCKTTTRLTDIRARIGGRLDLGTDFKKHLVGKSSEKAASWLVSCDHTPHGRYPPSTTLSR
jgi:hypothetical protein